MVKLEVEALPARDFQIRSHFEDDEAEKKSTLR